MTDSVDAWWLRRRWSKGVDVPYPPGAYAAFWSRIRRLVDCYDAGDNAGVLLSQVPPGADVWLVWHCGLGHEWVATPAEQLARTGRDRGGDRTCPVCTAPVREASAVARPDRPRPAPRPPRPRPAPAATAPGEAFTNPGLRLPTSAAEGRLVALLAERLEFTPGKNAIRIAGAFHGRDEVWPDLVLPELRIAVEYDTTGRIGDEHVGHRERSDRRKDLLLRRCGWEVVRVRTGGLAPLGPHDLRAAGVSAGLADRLLERFAVIRGDLIVAAYRRDAPAR